MKKAQGKGLSIQGKIDTLLRYPGGKFRAAKMIAGFVPIDTQELCSPFFGGGTVEIICAREGIRVYGYDILSPLVEFWQCVLEDGNRLADIVTEYYPLSKQEFYALQTEQWGDRSRYQRAAMFYVLNRSSFSGSTLSGGMSPGHPRFTLTSIQRLRDFQISGLSVEQIGFKESIPQHDDILLYLDPPYYIKSCLYGVNGDTHRGFQHAHLAEMLRARDNWILSYNNCPEIAALYDGYTFLYPEWSYGMSQDKTSKEVLILSPDIAEYHKVCHLCCMQPIFTIHKGAT